MTDTLRHWQFTDFGLPHLSLADAARPSPRPGQVLVRTEALSLNYRDLMLAENRYGQTPALPFTPGSDLAGIVEAVGPGVTRWTGGERVVSSYLTDWIDGVAPARGFALGVPGPGALATHVVLDAEWLAAAPASLSAVQASTLPVAALTAWFALVEAAALRAGQSVLIHGTGGVALFGVQFARMHGARAIVVSGDAAKRERVRGLGAQHVLARDADWVAAALEMTGGRGVDHVLETVGGANLGRSLQAVAQGGRVSLIGVLEGGDFSASAFAAIRSRATIQGISVGHRRGLEDMIRAIELNALEPVIAGEYDFADAPAAFAHLARGPFGKVVVRF